jgi:2-polyprenyl-3-methyl-5-hydroxy-6-metoxy-1,4-benzoquinol methylase
LSIKKTTNQEWHKNEKAWWNSNGSYMSYQWSLNEKMNYALRSELEDDYIKYLLKPGETLLDVGCGSGWLSIDFAKKNMEVLGIDVSETQIKTAISNKVNNDLKKLQFECADFIEWDITKYKNKFQSVFLNAFLHHLPENELKLVFEKLTKVMRPGGRVYLYEPLSCHKKKFSFASVADLFFKAILYMFIFYIPRFFKLYSKRHQDEVRRGYTMNSPHERPISIDWIDKYCSENFKILEVKPWHLYSIAYGMQTKALKPRIMYLYSLFASTWYKIDKCLLKIFGWQPFSNSSRFILCSIKLIKK